MKIKNSVHSVKPDIAVMVMCLAMLIVCPLRIFQMLRNMDSSTGFYNDSGSAAVIILYAVLALAALLILILTYLSASVPASKAPEGRRITLGIASLLFAASLFYDAISNYFSTGEATATIIQNVKSVSAMHHLHAVFAFLSCCYFIVFAVSYLTGVPSLRKKLKLLSLSPLVWAVIRVLEKITVIISIVRVSELLLELCAFVFLMTFFLSFARVVSDVNSKGSMWSVIGCGCVSALLLLTYSIPRAMLLLTGNADSLVNGYPFNISDACCALFIIVFVLTCLRCGYTVEDVEEMEAEIAEAAETDAEDGNQTPYSEPARDSDGNIIIAKSASDGGNDGADNTED